MICSIGGDPEQRYGGSYHRVWCENLNWPETATTASIG